MEWELTVQHLAERDLRSRYDWYQSQGAGLGLDFLKEAAKTFRIVETDPDRFQLYYGSYRQALFERFPFKVFFRIRGNRVIISRVLHDSQDHTRLLK